MNNYYNIEHIEYLKKIEFDKRLRALERKLKNKKIVLYGAGTFFQDLVKVYDLTKLNIIGIADRTFYNAEDMDKTFLGYTKFNFDDIITNAPDYILVSTLKSVDIIEELNAKVSKNIKVRPLIKKPVKDLWEDVWGGSGKCLSKKITKTLYPST